MSIAHINLATDFESSVQTFNNQLPESILMHPSEFISIEDNPRQRNTRKQAAKAIKRHLKEGHDVHAKVNIGQLPCGTQYKLDGHTRALLWQDGRLSAPARLSADIWECRDVEQVEALYLTFDNRDAAEQNNALLFGSLRSCGLEIQSGLLQNSGLYAALQHLFGAKDIALDLPQVIVPALRLIDEQDFSGHRINSGQLAAMIATFYRDGDKAAPFWIKHIEDEGIKKGKEWDGVYGLQVVMERLQKMGFGREVSRQTMRRSLSCYTSYQQNKWMKQNASEMSPLKFVPEGVDY